MAAKTEFVFARDGLHRCARGVDAHNSGNGSRCVWNGRTLAGRSVGIVAIGAGNVTRRIYRVLGAVVECGRLQHRMNANLVELRRNVFGDHRAIVTGETSFFFPIMNQQALL